MLTKELATKLMNKVLGQLTNNFIDIWLQGVLDFGKVGVSNDIQMQVSWMIQFI